VAGLAQARLFGGVDGGGTKTWAVVGDEKGRLLGFGAGGPANYHVFGLEFTLQSVVSALGQAAAAAGVEIGVLTRAAFYLGGDDSTEDHANLGEALRANLPSELAIQWDNDCWAALRGGTEKNWGAVVIGGSGSNSAAISPDGRRAILRGLGRDSGNPGGAGDIAREAMYWAFRMDEGMCPKTSLHGAILEALELTDYDAVVRESAGAGLAFGYRVMGIVGPLVFHLAREGDPRAQDILMEMGRLMGEQTGAVMKRAGIEGLKADVVLAGSTYRGESPLLIDSLTLALHRWAPKAKPRLPLHQPVVGAYLLALEGEGLTVGPEADRNLAATVKTICPSSPSGHRGKRAHPVAFGQNPL